jgi:diaminopimelate decarboxylase
MSYFSYRPDTASQQNSLHAESVSLLDIAQRFGTPTYVYSRAAFEDRFNDYKEAMGDREHLICYAVKANSNLAVLNLLARLGAGFDIVSAGELQRVIAAGGDPKKVVFSGVAKTHDEIALALDAGIHCFNVESEAELERINEIASARGETAPVSLRVNPDVDANTHPYISTGLKDNKFGIAIHLAKDVYQRATQMSGIKICGVDCHIGSQLTEVSPFADALDRVLALVDELAEAGIHIEHIDLGGGLGVRYKDEEPPTPQQYLGQLLGKLDERKLKVVVEPGRSISANAGILLTKVEYLKDNEHKHFAIVDAAMNDMIRPALYSAWLNIDPVVVNTSGTAACFDIVGPVCETGDFLGKERDLCLSPGDLLSVGGSGAYGFTMSSNYNSRGRAAEIMVDGEQVYLVRQRETFDDLIRGENLLPES